MDFCARDALTRVLHILNLNFTWIYKQIRWNWLHFLEIASIEA